MDWIPGCCFAEWEWAFLSEWVSETHTGLSFLFLFFSLSLSLSLSLLLANLPEEKALLAFFVIDLHAHRRHPLVLLPFDAWYFHWHCWCSRKNLPFLPDLTFMFYARVPVMTFLTLFPTLVRWCTHSLEQLFFFLSFCPLCILQWSLSMFICLSSMSQSRFFLSSSFSWPIFYFPSVCPLWILLSLKLKIRWDTLVQVSLSLSLSLKRAFASFFTCILFNFPFMKFPLCWLSLEHFTPAAIAFDLPSNKL